MWFRRERARTSSKASAAADDASRSTPFNYSALPEPEQPTLDELVSEGVMLAEFAGRLALKNQIIIGALADRKDYDIARYADTAREVLSELERASEESAALAADSLTRATGRGGTGKHQHDYRDNDIENLRLREKVHRAVAARLAGLLRDDDFVAGFVKDARDAAWADIGTAITARLDRQWPPFRATADIDTPSARDLERQRRRQMRQLRQEIGHLEREYRQHDNRH